MQSINLYSLKLVKEKSILNDIGPNIIRQPKDAYDIVTAVLQLQYKPFEHFGNVALNTLSAVVGIHTLAIGTVDATHIHQREIFKAALMNNATYIIIFHNHPSGDPTPSQDDVDMTRQIELSARVMGIPILDHIIIGENSGKVRQSNRKVTFPPPNIARIIF